MEKKLEVKNLQIAFRTQAGILKAVRDISFDLHKGETLAIVGESGSGKSVTSKAIIGILAGNSIVEGGEILYDGQDLLKISEDDFHKIRGDKISMIFQDPLSSLNPIMRVGQQLTEAMLLKNKSSRRNARHNFNGKLKLLNNSINDVVGKDNAEAINKTNEYIKTFDAFCIQATKLERIYNEANATIIELQLTIENILFLIDKKQKINIIKELKVVKHEVTKSMHPYVLVEDDELSHVLEEIDSLIKLKKKIDINQAISVLNKLLEIVNKTILKKKPEYFSLGYYVMKNPEEDVCSMGIDELNKMTNEYLNDNFLEEFKRISEIGVLNCHQKSIEIKKDTLEKARDFLQFVQSNDFNKNETYIKAKEISRLVAQAIDRLTIKKKSIEYAFTSALRSAISVYYQGIHRNPIEQRKYNRLEKRYNKLIAAGKMPDWKLTPPALVDIDLAHRNICRILEVLIASLENDIKFEEDFNKEQEVMDLIEYLQNEASNLVAKLTHKMAKARAVKLLEEVGIDSPLIRYRQYPFQFSGGMRQRIVIAIALSANPDILICDEPTTALDVTIQAQILELINKIKAERNLSIIFITHNLGVVANMADRVAVMYAGKIVEYGTTEEVFYDPRHPYTWALLSSMPDINTKERLEAIPGTPPNMIYPPAGDAFASRNKYAMEIDFELQPPLFEVTETHYAATWLLHPNAPKTVMPKIISARVERIKEEIAKNE